jgi:hypothetical protein
MCKSHDHRQGHDHGHGLNEMMMSIELRSLANSKFATLQESAPGGPLEVQAESILATAFTY